MKLTLKALEPTLLVFVDSKDQDQTAQNMQSDLRSTLSTILLRILAIEALVQQYFRRFFY